MNSNQKPEVVTQLVQELVNTMSDMKFKSQELRKQIISEEQEKQQIEQDLNTLTNRLESIEEESIHLEREKQEL